MLPDLGMVKYVHIQCDLKVTTTVHVILSISRSHHALTCVRSLHTSGHGLTVRHYRNGAEVTPSIDQDLNYDFNYQQYRSVTPRKVMPVGMLLEMSSICNICHPLTVHIMCM